MGISVQLVTHCSMQSHRPPQHPTKAPGCFYTTQGCSFANSHQGLSQLLPKPAAPVLPRAGLTWYCNCPTASPSHSGHLLCFFPSCLQLKVPECFLGHSSVSFRDGKARNHGHVDQQGGSSQSGREQLGGCASHEPYTLSRRTKFCLCRVLLVQHSIQHFLAKV